MLWLLLVTVRRVGFRQIPHSSGRWLPTVARIPPMHRQTTAILAVLLMLLQASAFGEDVVGTRPLLVATQKTLPTLLPQDIRLLHDPIAIETFLASLDGIPPDWHAFHGAHGDHQSEQLFALNRERDRLRTGRQALAQRITFLWNGVLSCDVPDRGGFLVAIGPEMIATKWGIVRFKPENLPVELVAVPPAKLKESLRQRAAHGESIPVMVAMTGRLVPDESLIYDFAHEDPSQGMIMPMVRVERVDYFISP